VLTFRAWTHAKLNSVLTTFIHANVYIFDCCSTSDAQLIFRRFIAMHPVNQNTGSTVSVGN